MSNVYKVYLTIIMLILLSIPSHAEIIFKNNSLSMNVHGTTVHEVLDLLTQHANISIVALEETNVGNVRISKKFWGLPLEEGIHRLLNGWNYGISLDRSTGKITTLYLVSQRKNSSDSGSQASTWTSYPSHHLTSHSHPQPTTLSKNSRKSILESTKDRNLNVEEDFLSDKDIEALPPNFLETLERWQRNGKG